MAYVDDFHCVVCGVYIGSRYDEGGNHHCEPKRLARIEGGRRSHAELNGNREPTDAQRLSMGCFLMGLSEED